MSHAEFMAVEEMPESVYLHAGQVYAARHAALVSTVLGSCIAVCLWDPVARVGGMNHFLLPKGKGPRYGNDAMQQLIDEMTSRGARVVQMVAKVFGGAGEATGIQNAEAAAQFLAALAIPVHAEQTGGLRGRRLLFHTGTGQAYVKEI